MKKIILIGIGVLFLSGCAETTALLGPALIGGHSGSITKASLNYSAGYFIEKSTGKRAFEHAMSMVQEPIQKRKEKKIKEDFTKFLKKHILSTRKQLLQNN